MQPERDRIDGAVLSELARNCAQHEALFLQRIYSEGLTKYRRRIASVGLNGCERVLDAGCGFGQWSLALAAASDEVVGIDISPARISVCRDLAASADQSNVRFVVAGAQACPFPDGCFDGAVSYSALYFTDFPQAIKEIGRVVRRGALFYLSTNAIGAYVKDLIWPRNRTDDFDTRKYGLRSLLNTVLNRRHALSAQRGTAAMSVRATERALREAGFELLQVGGEGQLGHDPAAFLPSRFLGLRTSFDILSKKG
jgi:SAM-dependent methyltransferase